MIKLTITQVQHYSESMFRLRTDRPITFRFTAGEFVMIRCRETSVERAYSITSGPGDDYLEFLSIKVPNGELTGELSRYEPGDTLYMSERSTGTLTLANIELGGDLWMLASGTGVAPFISILRDPHTYTSFDTIHLAWSVRRRVDLNAYNNFIESMPVDFMPIVTQDPEWTGMNKRITTQLSAGTLIPNLHANNKVMVCGSMEFNTDIKTMLKDWGWTEGNKRTAGTFVQEKAYVER
jgi:ferredoxin/flavodoxin---NADP+ reductase